MAYERQSPDYTELVKKIAAKYPKEWDLADKDKHGSRTDDFIRIFAYEAFKVDMRIGLNGKRGNPNDISKDAVAYQNDTVPFELGGCEVIDIIVGNPHGPAWQDVTLPNVAGAWIQPTKPGGVVDNPGTNGPIDNVGNGNEENKNLQSQINELKRMLEKTIKVGDKVNFKTQDWGDYKGRFVCSEKDNNGRLIANRDDVGTWEELTIGRKD